MTTGERIKAARNKAGLKQSELAEKLGVAVITIGQYERDKRQPRIEQIQAIAAALDVSPIFLIGYDERLLDGFTPEQQEGIKRGALEAYRRQAEAANTPLGRIHTALALLNHAGQQEAVKRVEELTEIPRYQAGSPAQAAGNAPPPSPEGKGTTPSPPPPESP